MANPNSAYMQVGGRESKLPWWPKMSSTSSRSEALASPVEPRMRKLWKRRSLVAGAAGAVPGSRPGGSNPGGSSCAPAVSQPWICAGSWMDAACGAAAGGS